MEQISVRGEVLELPAIEPLDGGAVCAISTSVATGMRPRELCKLRPCDIDRSGVVLMYRPRIAQEHEQRQRASNTRSWRCNLTI